MKKCSVALFAFITVLAFLFSFLPMNIALAKENTQLTLLVRNRTGGIVELKIVDENQNPRWFKYEPGQTQTPLPEGTYAYYASTDCGNRSGTFNINVTKELIFSCGDGVEVTLKRSLPTGRQYCYGIYDYWGFTNGEWAYMGDYCQGAPAYVGQDIQYTVPDPAGTYSGDAWFYNSGGDACAPDHGSAFYYYDCYKGGN